MSRTIVKYSIPIDANIQGHRLGINGLGVDPSSSGLLYSAGRDGMIACWDLNLQIRQGPDTFDGDLAEYHVDDVRGAPILTKQIQAHTNWINDLKVSQDHQTVYTCSSDMTVKAWRPHGAKDEGPSTIGEHMDYVKCMTLPSWTNEFVATGSLDRRIVAWDANGQGERFKIDVDSAGGGMKGSVYALGSGGGLLASGGPERAIRVWDARNGQRVTKFVGHTDNVRDILISRDGKTILSASSDTTIKIWSLTAGRCLHTLTMHSDSVWSLHSNHPELLVFHAGDRSGLVTRTDLRNIDENGDGDCFLVCKESNGVSKIATLGDRVFTATSSSSISRWVDAPLLPLSPSNPFDDPENTDQVPALSPTHSHMRRRSSMSTNYLRRSFRKDNSRIKVGLLNGLLLADSHNGNEVSTLYSAASVVSLPIVDEDVSSDGSTSSLVPIRTEPEHVIAGSHGLIKGQVLQNRRQVLTQSTNGEITLWDIVRCVRLKDFGVIDFHQTMDSLNSDDVIRNWFNVNTRIGDLTIELDERIALDAEIYVDELEPPGTVDEEQGNRRRIIPLISDDMLINTVNIGKWVLRSLFYQLIDAEIARDDFEVSRLTKPSSQRSSRRSKRPGSLNLSELKDPTPNSENETPRASQVNSTFASRNPYANMATPGQSIGLATPMPTFQRDNPNGQKSNTQGTGDEHQADYFSSIHGIPSAITDPPLTTTTSITTNTASSSNGASPTMPGGFMKGMKWLRGNKAPRTSSASVDLKNTTPMTLDDKIHCPTGPAIGSTAHPTSTIMKPAPKTFGELLKLERTKFASRSEEDDRKGWIVQPEEYHTLKIPSYIQVGIAEFSATAGEAKDVYYCSVGNIGTETEILGEVLPAWLCELLLLNHIPKGMGEPPKIAFILSPHPSSRLPDIGSTTRLNASRALRVRKVFVFVSSRLVGLVDAESGGGKKEEEWMEIFCAGQKLDANWTLMQVRQHIWKSGSDIMMHYKLLRE